MGKICAMYQSLNPETHHAAAFKSRITPAIIPYMIFLRLLVFFKRPLSFLRRFRRHVLCCFYYITLLPRAHYKIYGNITSDSACTKKKGKLMAATVPLSFLSLHLKANIQCLLVSTEFPYCFPKLSLVPYLCLPPYRQLQSFALPFYPLHIFSIANHYLVSPFGTFLLHISSDVTILNYHVIAFRTRVIAVKICQITVDTAIV